MPGSPRPGPLVLRRRRSWDQTAPAVGGLAPAATVIPWTWLTTPLELRTYPPINSAQVGRTGGANATSNNTTSQATYGVFAATTSSSLDTASPDDASNFASWLTTYYANPLLRPPVLTLSLVPRVDAERAIILAREIGDRITLGQGTVVDGSGTITILSVPAGLPTAVQSFVIEGIQHTSSVNDRTVQWTCAPLFGTTAGSEGPWFRLDTSVLGGSDLIPF